MADEPVVVVAEQVDERRVRLTGEVHRHGLRSPVDHLEDPAVAAVNGGALTAGRGLPTSVERAVQDALHRCAGGRPDRPLDGIAPGGPEIGHGERHAAAITRQRRRRHRQLPLVAMV